MKKYLVVISILFFLQQALLSQQMAEYNLYHYNLSLVNPASTGYLSCKQFNLTDRHQWTGMEGAPSIQSFGMQLPKHVSRDKLYGVGINLVRDINGATQNIGGELQYAYHIPLRTLNPSHLSFGLSGKFGQYWFDESDFNPYQIDPIVTYGKELEWYYNFATGIFTYSKKYYVGIGVYNLFPRTTRFYSGYGNDSYFATFIAGYTFQNTRKYNFAYSPSVYFAYGDSFYQLDISNKIYIENGFWTGFCVRKYMGEFYSAGQNLLVFLGYNYAKWDIAYAYDLGLNGMQKHHFGSHQLSLTYTICREKYACPEF